MFDCYNIGQIYGRDFAKICGLLRIYELYHEVLKMQIYHEGIVFKGDS